MPLGGDDGICPPGVVCQDKPDIEAPFPETLRTIPEDDEILHWPAQHCRTRHEVKIDRLECKKLLADGGLSDETSSETPPPSLSGDDSNDFEASDRINDDGRRT